MGMLYRKKFRDKHGNWKLSKRWTIRYRRNGKQYQEATGFISKTKARDLLALREGDIKRGMPVDPAQYRITYDDAATGVTTTAGQAWAIGGGVCQDYSHTLLSLLRALHIPARYVSGYLHTEDEAPGQTVVGESHAWIEVWNGGWEAHDPTNDRSVGSAHVVVAKGRDYADVPPLKGIYAGGLSESLGVSVEITQLEA